MNRPLALVLALALTLFSRAAPPAHGQAGKLDREISQLLEQVDGFDDELRERATRRLVELGDVALPALRRKLPGAGPRKLDYQEMIDRIEARRALREAERADEQAHAEALAEDKVLRAHWTAFVERYISTRLERVEDLLRSGQQTEGLELLDALARVQPRMPEALTQRMDKLRQRLKETRFRRTALAGEIEVERSVYRWGEPIRVTFAVTNRGKQEFVIAIASAQRPSTIHLEYKVRDYTLYGQVRASQRTAAVDMGKADIVLPRAKTWRTSAIVGLPPQPGPRYLYREVLVIARGIPAAMSAEARLTDQLTLKFPDQRFRVFPDGYQRYTARPLKALAGGIRLDQPDTVFVAGLLVAPHRHKEAIGLLVDGLTRRRSSLRRTSVALLERFTGQRFPQAETWALWWKAHRERFQPRDTWDWGPRR